MKMSKSSRNNLKLVHEQLDSLLEYFQRTVDSLTMFVEEADENGEISISERNEIRNLVLKLDKTMNKVFQLEGQVPVLE
jgi:hypothetical protein